MTTKSLLQRLGRNKAMSRAMRRSVPLDRTVTRLTRGRARLIPRALLPQLTLTTIGRRTGAPRSTPLIYIEDGDDYLVVASNFGQDRHPAWSYNLEANSDAAVAIGARTIAVHARRLIEQERTAVWPKVVTVWPAYREYQQWAQGRTIKVYRLTPA